MNPAPVPNPSAAAPHASGAARAPSAMLVRSRRVRDVVTTVFFALVLVAPSIDLVVRPASVRDPARFEMRAPARRPDWPVNVQRLNTFPQRFTNWFDDQLGLRDQLLRFGSIVKLFGFGVSPTKDVLPGKNGFLFYTGNHTIEVHRGVFPFSPQQLDDACRLLEARRLVCEQRGAAYVFVVAPDKESIYPDFLPAGCEPVGPSRLDQLVKAVAQRAPKVELLDLRPAFRAARRQDGPRDYLYSELGTHWDGRGNYLGYREIARALQRHFPAIEPFAWDEIVRTPSPQNLDSWGLRMYVHDLLDTHSLLVDAPAGRKRARLVRDESESGGTSEQRTDDERLPRVFVLHDSFLYGVLPLLAEHCEQLDYSPSDYLDPAVIDALRPDVVVELWVERFLGEWNPAQRMPRVAPAGAPR